jgi:hypothetical protein
MYVVWGNSERSATSIFKSHDEQTRVQESGLKTDNYRLLGLRLY